MSAVLSPADRTAGFAGAVTMEDEPVKPPKASHIYSDGANIGVQDYSPGTDRASVMLDATVMRGPNLQTSVGVSLHLPPSKALELATALFHSASRLIAAQDAKEREGVKA